MNDYKATRTISGHIGYTAASTSISTALSADTDRNTRAVRNRRFVGAVMYNDHQSTQPLTPTITVTNGTVSRKLDRTTIQTGDSAVWNEEDYAIDLDSDQYISISVAETLVNGDNLYVFLRFKDSFK
jgi:hypothetical protein